MVQIFLPSFPSASRTESSGCVTGKQLLVDRGVEWTAGDASAQSGRRSKPIWNEKRSFVHISQKGPASNAITCRLEFVYNQEIIRQSNLYSNFFIAATTNSYRRPALPGPEDFRDPNSVWFTYRRARPYGIRICLTPREANHSSARIKSLFSSGQVF